MPAVKTSHRHNIVIVIEIVNQLIMGRIIWISQIRCAIILFHGLTEPKPRIKADFSRFRPKTLKMRLLL